jgi:PhoPQ-activated pathogenicity-related protein
VYSQTQIEKELSKLTNLVKSGRSSEALARNIHKLVGLEVNQLEIDLAATEKDLGEFEQHYGMSTADFFNQWQAGKTDDRMDYVEWASLTQIADNLQKRLELLISAGM